MNDSIKDKHVVVNSVVSRPAEPRKPDFYDYPEKDTHWTNKIRLQKVDDSVPRVGDPEPKHTVTVDVQNSTLTIKHVDGDPVTAPLSLPSIQALYHPSEKDYFTEGIKLRISRKDLATPLGFETLLQILMMNMISAVFPRICRWAPMQNRLQMFSINTEANHIRNSVLINQFNHSHILNNSLAGKPILLALPGPSLDVEYIRKHRSSFVLMSAGRAAEKLFNTGIDPDIVYIQDVNAAAWGLNFDSLGERKTSSILIANPAGRMWKYAKNFQRVFKAWNLYPFETDNFPRLEEIAPSTTSGAYSVARLLGGNPLLLIGNDSGSNVEPPKKESLPEALTNLKFEKDGKYLVFKPTDYLRELFLRFGDEFSVMTQIDYIAGVQWLKIKVTQDMAQHDLKVYDLSTTNLSRFNSPVLDGADYKPSGKVSLPNFPYYSTNYDVKKFLLQKKSAYSFMKRQLNKGFIPDAAWRFPHSCVLTHTTIQRTDNVYSRPIDVQIVKDNTEFILQHVEIALEELAEQRAMEK